MANTNQAAQRPRFSVAITTPAYQNLIHNTLSDPDRASRFIAAITSAVAVNPNLQDCESNTIIAGALLGESLGLSPSPQLGQYYLVPFKSKAKYDRDGNVTSPEMIKAQFVLGYKGYIQLAIRSGQYKKLNVLEIKAGELRRFDPLNEEIDCALIEDYAAREAAPTIGYYAMFEYVNGFRKAMYWSREKMELHADRYSPAFSLAAYRKVQAGEIAERDMWKYSSFWYKNFDDMAKKTMLRQLISRWGVMSIEMQSAFERDQNFIDVNANRDGFFETPETPDLLPPADNPAVLADGDGDPADDAGNEVNLNEL
jgi:recombination protein RecT